MWDPAGDDEAERPPMPAVPDAPFAEAPGAGVAPEASSLLDQPVPVPPVLSPSNPPPAAPPSAPDARSWRDTPKVPPATERSLFSPASATEPTAVPPALTPPPTPIVSEPTSVLVGTPFPESTADAKPPLSPARPAGVASPHVAPGPPPSRRRWPLVLLALATVAASAGVSWLVARDTVRTETVVLPAETTDGGGTADSVPAVSNTVNTPVIETTAATSPLGDEPFAEAAAKIAPSVVQLSLSGGLGSGVIIDVNGTILTAAHVVGNNSEVDVRLYDGTVIEGSVLGTHDGTDVAVVSIDPTGLDLVAAPLADVDEVRVGQLAVAVGSPFGFTQSVTAGIISGVDRVVNNVSMVQTDAPINPGNSGGPLIDLEGRVVGINDLIFTQSGSNAGVGFAISIDLAMIVADQIIAGGEVQLALLGVQTSPTDDGRAGALIVSVVDGSAAADAGLDVGDLVVAVDGQPTPGSTQLRAQVIDNPPGTVITLDVIREGERLSIEATLGSAG